MSNAMPPPMKFWELVSAFRSEEDLLVSIFSTARWREPYLQYWLSSNQLVSEQRRDILDALVPVDLSREVAARSRLRFFYHPTDRILRSRPTQPGQHSSMTALEIHDRFGGSIIEEVLEYGSATVTDHAA